MTVFVVFAALPVSAADEVLLAQAAESAVPEGSYTLKLAVASVLLNRVKDRSFPNSLGAVIEDAGIEISVDAPSAESVRAARDAISDFDPTSGALYFSQQMNDAPVLFETGSYFFY